MKNWAEDLLEKLRTKRAELQRQLSGVETAIEAIEHAYDMPALTVPGMFKQDLSGNGKVREPDN